MAYTFTGLAVYWALYKIPRVAAEVQKIIDLAGGPDTPVLKDAGPVVLAFIVAAVFPEIPPFKGADRTVRTILYERACIPAQKLHERNRLKLATYKVDAKELEAVRKNLEAEGFDRRDLVYEGEPTVRSMWTKISLLIAYIARWQGKDKFKTAFALLRERDSGTLSVDRVTQVYEALKGNAKSCFREMRDHPDEPETEARAQAFRRECKELLMQIYTLLSRVSLKSHFTDRERIKSMAKIGFVLEPDEGGPLPDPNDLVALGLVLGVVLIVPLSARLGAERALMIGVITYTAVLIPILIANRYPEFALNPGRGTPAVAFPVVSGFVAAAIGMVFAVTWNALHPESGALIDFANGWSSYASRAYPWSTLHALYAVLIAWRIRTGTYPDPIKLKGVARYREWGNVWDALIFAGCAVALMVLFVRPQLAVLWERPEVASNWRILIMPGIVAFALGFFVPTWYRAHMMKKKVSEDLQPAPDAAPVTP
jgi:hypothetical protein